MNSSGNHRPEDSAAPPTAPNQATDGWLELRLRPIEPQTPDEASSKPAATKRTAGRTVPHGAETAPPQTLTAFDWLDTIVDDVLLSSGQAVDRPAAAAAPPALASWRNTEFVDVSLGPDSSGVLAHVVLGYSPVIDQRQAIIATRLTVVPMRADMSLDAGALLRAVGEVWPVGGGAVSLNIASETLLTDLLRAKPTTNVMIEVPSFLAAEPSNVDTLLELAARGNTLLIKGRPPRELPREALRCFKWSIVDLADDRRIGQTSPPPGVGRTIPYLQTGVRTMAQLRDSFERGAVAVIGWPIHEPGAADAQARPDLQVVLEMISRIDRGDSTEVIEHTIMRDPALAFELLRHINSPSFGLRVETGSFRHAISILGYQQLKRWLTGWLAATADDNRFNAVNFAALRRGLLMRQLAQNASDAETRSEMFMCGVFSLLDRIFAKPLGELLQTLAVPERVRQALVDRSGPFFPMLELVRAVETEVPHDIRAAADAAFVEPLEINRALLRTLLVASSLG